MKKKAIIIALAGTIVLGASIVGGTMAARNVSTEDNATTSEGVIRTNSLEIKMDQQVESETIHLNDPVEITYTISNATEESEEACDRFVRIKINKEFGYDTSSVEVLPIGENAADWVVIDPLKNYEKIANKYESLARVEEVEAVKGVYESLAEYYQSVASREVAIEGVPEQYIYVYYKNSLTPNEEATCNLQVVFTGSPEAEYSADSQIIIDATADAVQAVAASKAIPSEWGMFVELSEDGKEILSISETPLSE